MKKTPLKHGKGFTAQRKPMKAVSAKKAKEKHPMRKSAKGQMCTLRLSGCSGDSEETVLCHIRRNGWGGMGSKPHDILAFFACRSCHEKEERHHPSCSDADILRALGETLMIQVSKGIIRVGGGEE